jgi:hypothetical protein
VLPLIARVKKTNCSEDVITPQKPVMEAQQTVSVGDCMRPIKLTNIETISSGQCLCAFQNFQNEESQKKHLTQIIFESKKYIKILKDSLIAQYKEAVNIT